MMRRVTFLAIFLLALCLGAFAQGPGGNNPSGPFAQFQKSHKYTFMLSRMAANIGRLEKTKAPLSAKQAKSVLAVLQPLRKKTSLTQEEAKASIKKLKAILTEKQLTEIGKMKPEARRFRSGGPGRPVGSTRVQGGRQGQGRPHFDMNSMKNFNPFNPPKGTPMAEHGSKRMNDLFGSLSKVADSAHDKPKYRARPSKK